MGREAVVGAVVFNFRIDGMDCAEEVSLLKREVGPLVGGEDRLGFDILNGKMTVTVSDATRFDPNQIMSVVGRAGLRAEVWRETRDSRLVGGFWALHGRTLLTSASGILAATGFVAHAALSGGLRRALGLEGLGHTETVPALAKGLYALGILAGAWQVLSKAWHAALRLRPDMNLLMLVAVIGAACIGEWFEAATVAFLFAVSLLLESWSVGRARKAVAALMELTPVVAHVKSS